MCRWFAYISPTEECLLDDVLVTPTHSLTKQVNSHYLPKLLEHHPLNPKAEHEIAARNRLFNVDGFGLAYYTTAQSSFTQSIGSMPVLYKSAQPPLHDTNFRSLAVNTSTLALFAHIRAATATPTVQVNNHPFAFGRHCVMHNGVIGNFVTIARDLCMLLDDDAYSNITGSTDSEHFAALYITYLCRGRGKEAWSATYSVQQMRDALIQAMVTIFELQVKKLGVMAPANSLNVATSDGERLVCIRVRNHAIEQPPSLYWSTTAGTTLNSKFPDHPDGLTNSNAVKGAEEHGEHIIVASEPSTYKAAEWNLIEKNHCLLYDGTLRLEEVQYPIKLNSSVDSL